MSPAPRDDVDRGAATAAMASLVGSLADNKAALGRRYAEWAVSAPDARVRRRRRRDGPGRARPRALHLPGAQGARRRRRRRGPRRPRPPARAARRRAARLDGVHRRQPARRRRADDVRRRVRGLVASTQMAQRAKKILQEEGSHRVHAEAWARRLCRAGGGQRDALVARLLETWEHAGRWMGPDDDPGVAAAARGGHDRARPGRPARAGARLARRPARRARASTIALTEPTDWSRLGPRAAALRAVSVPTCPFCGAGDGRARRPVGRADHHRPVALPGVQLVLRGRARGLRRPRPGRPARGTLT